MYHRQVGATLSRMKRIVCALAAALVLAGCSDPPSEREMLQSLRDAGVDTARIVEDYPKFERAMESVCARPSELAGVAKSRYPTKVDGLFAMYRVWAEHYCPDEAARFTR